jgi:hypothetical protein
MTDDQLNELAVTIMRALMDDEGVVDCDDPDRIVWCQHRFKRAVLPLLRSALNPPEGCVRWPDGSEPRVLGTLPMTADGCVVGIDSFVWTMPPHCANPAGFGFRVTEIHASGPGHRECEPKWGDCYSTRQAAEAAREQKGNP